MCKNQLSEQHQWLVWFSVLSSPVHRSRETESRILRNKHGMGKNNKSIVSGSETIDRGVACCVSHEYWAFPISAGFPFPFIWAVMAGNSLSQQISLTFFILPVGDGFVHGVCFEESNIPGWVPTARDKEPQPSNTAPGTWRGRWGRREWGRGAEMWWQLLTNAEFRALAPSCLRGTARYCEGKTWAASLCLFSIKYGL